MANYFNELPGFEYGAMPMVKAPNERMPNYFAAKKNFWGEKPLEGVPGVGGLTRDRMMMLGSLLASLGGKRFAPVAQAGMQIGGAGMQERLQQDSPERRMAEAKMTAMEGAPPEVQQAMLTDLPKELWPQSLKDKAAQYMTQMTQAQQVGPEHDIAAQKYKWLTSPEGEKYGKMKELGVPEWNLSVEDQIKALGYKSRETEAGQPIATTEHLKAETTAIPQRTAIAQGHLDLEKKRLDYEISMKEKLGGMDPELRKQAELASLPYRDAVNRAQSTLGGYTGHDPGLVSNAMVRVGSSASRSIAALGGLGHPYAAPIATDAVRMMSDQYVVLKDSAARQRIALSIKQLLVSLPNPTTQQEAEMHQQLLEEVNSTLSLAGTNLNTATTPKKKSEGLGLGKGADWIYNMFKGGK